MRRFHAAALAIGLFGLAPAAHAITTIANHELLPNGTTAEQCLARAEAAISGAGLQPLSPTRTARWGQNASGTEIYTIYCVPDRASAVVVGATAGESGPVDSMVTQLRELFRSGGGARPGVK